MLELGRKFSAEIPATGKVAGVRNSVENSTSGDRKGRPRPKTKEGSKTAKALLSFAFFLHYFLVVLVFVIHKWMWVLDLGFQQ